MKTSSPNTALRLRKLPAKALYHLHTAYLFSCSDLEAIVIAPFIFALLASQAAPLLSMGDPPCSMPILLRAPQMIIWSWSGLLLFNLHNQRHRQSVEEDAVNKPWRPIPSGRLTPEQATVVLFCLYPLNLIVSLAVGGLVPLAVITTFSVWNNEFQDRSGGFLKNLHNGMGITAFLAGPLEIATGNSIFGGQAIAAGWLGVIAMTITCTIHVQDLRDMEGDAVAGKRTIPILMGEMNARLFVALGVAFWSAFGCWFWDTWMEGILMAGLGLTLISNMVGIRTRAGDRLSYRLWAPWLLALALLPYMKSLRLGQQHVASVTPSVAANTRAV